MLPQPRTKLRGVSSRNQSLQDILKTCRGATEILSVKIKDNGIHNTQIVVLMESGEERIHFYDRLLLNAILPKTFTPSGNIQNDIKTLNDLGFDFTEDDLEIVQGKFKAKETSLGYIGVFGESGGDDGEYESALCSIALNRLHLAPDLWYGEWVGAGVENSISWDIRVNGVLYPYSQTGVGIVGDGTEFSTNWFEGWMDTFKGLTTYWESAPHPTQPDTWLDYAKYVNFSNRCYDFELIPSRNYLSEIPEDRMMADLSGNPSFTIHDDGRITFALAAFQTECTLPNAKPITFKPINYDLVGKNYVELHFSIEDLVTGDKLENQMFGIDTLNINAKTMITSARHPSLSLATNAGYPSFQDFFDELVNAFANLPQKYEFIPRLVRQTSVSKQEIYLGFNPRNLSTWPQPGPVNLYLGEAKLASDSNVTQVIDDFGTVTIDAVDLDDFIGQAIAFFQPKLEAAGFLVEEYNVGASTSEMTGRGLKLTKSASHDIILMLMPPEGGDVLWMPFEGDFWQALLIKTEIFGPMVTEEMIKDKIDIILAPVGSTNEFNDYRHTPQRITFHANPNPDPTIYDWITENNNGQPIVLDTCGILDDNL